MEQARINQQWLPSATYRLQFNKNFTFKQATDLVEYFNLLGITECYASPLCLACPGSIHGYDVTDYTKINPEIGTEEDLGRFVTRLFQKEMGLILDVVPNHMSIADLSNQWWFDILEQGPSSEFAHYFDIQWKPPKVVLANKVLLPFLGEQYGKTLEDQQIKVCYGSGLFFALYGDKKLPLAQRTWSLILGPVLIKVKALLDEKDPNAMELESIISALSHLPPLTEKNTEKLKEARREKEIIKRRINALLEGSREIRAALEQSLLELNGKKTDPRSFDALDELISQQAYRLCFWRVASEEINYRRFFDVNELAAIRVEEPEVFFSVHELVFWLIQQGWITGLRVDHVDGLYDPMQYLKDLQEGCRQALSSQPRIWEKREVEKRQMRFPEDPKRPFYIVVEKILSQNEELRSDWPIYGTTGYEFLNLLNGLFVDRNNKQAFQKLYVQFADAPQRTSDLVYSCKKTIMFVSMSSEIYALSMLLDQISEQHRWSQDFTLGNLRFGLREVIACFPVYRSYAREDESAVDEESLKHIITAIREAKRRNRTTSESLFDFIQSVLLLEDPEGLTAAQKKERRVFVMRFQQLTGAIMAKGMEDTAFFRNYPLASINEVGAGWGTFGFPVERFHSDNQIRLEKWPDTMLATSTHDTKRGEDARARINVLSEIPEEWEKSIERWHTINAPRKKIEDELEIPSTNEEYLLYQELIGSWPFESMEGKSLEDYLERIKRHMKKVMREAKVHTSWVNPNNEYEAAFDDFIQKILTPTPENQFLKDFKLFLPAVVRAGIYNSLSQTLLKMTVPGIPDFYQGCELWNLQLVDPDNRGVIDYVPRAKLLAKLQPNTEKEKMNLVKDLRESIDDGRLKLYLISQVLNFRRLNQKLFARGDYISLHADGLRKDHLIAFARHLGDKSMIVVASRFFTKLGSLEEAPVGNRIWKDTTISLEGEVASGHYRDLFTGREIAVVPNGEKRALNAADVLTELPFSLLILKDGCE